MKQPDRIINEADLAFAGFSAMQIKVLMLMTNDVRLAVYQIAIELCMDDDAHQS